MSLERIRLTREEVDARLKQGEFVHTFKQTWNCLFGCDVARSRILDLADEGKAELAGEMAESMGHGIAVWDGDTPMFCET